MSKLFYFSLVTSSLLVVSLFSQTLTKPAPTITNPASTTATKTASLEGGQSVSNPSNDFTLTLPSGWTVKEGGENNVFIASSSEKGDLSENLVIVSFKMITQKYTLDQFYSQGLTALQEKLQNFRLIKNGQGTIGGVPTKWLIYEHSLDNIHAEVIQYLVLTKEKGYVLTFTASPENFDQAFPLFQKISNTIQFNRK